MPSLWSRGGDPGSAGFRGSGSLQKATTVSLVTHSETVEPQKSRPAIADVAKPVQTADIEISMDCDGREVIHLIRKKTSHGCFLCGDSVPWFGLLA